MSWLKEDIADNRIIGAKSLTYVYTCIDASCAVHKIIRSHTVGAISMVHGVLHEKALVQRLNTKSSTEVEIVWCE